MQFENLPCVHHDSLSYCTRGYWIVKCVFCDCFRQCDVYLSFGHWRTREFVICENVRTAIPLSLPSVEISIVTKNHAMVATVLKVEDDGLYKSRAFKVDFFHIHGVGVVAAHNVQVREVVSFGEYLGELGVVAMAVVAQFEVVDVNRLLLTDVMDSAVSSIKELEQIPVVYVMPLPEMAVIWLRCEIM